MKTSGRWNALPLELKLAEMIQARDHAVLMAARLSGQVDALVAWVVTGSTEGEVVPITK